METIEKGHGQPALDKGPAPKKAYHHGDLRQALIEAAEDELRANGIEGFTLRGCAKRVGVSHAAPAHHFRDTNALLTELAAVGFRKLVEAQKERQAHAPGDPRSQMVAAGLGYVDFTLSNPELFKLIFSSKRADFCNSALEGAAQAAYEHLLSSVDAMTGTARDGSLDAVIDLMAIWSTAHGLADLLMSGRMKAIQALDPAERDAALARILCRALRDGQGEAG